MNFNFEYAGSLYFADKLITSGDVCHYSIYVRFSYTMELGIHIHAISKQIQILSFEDLKKYCKPRVLGQNKLFRKLISF